MKSPKVVLALIAALFLILYAASVGAANVNKNARVKTMTYHRTMNVYNNQDVEYFLDGKLLWKETLHFSSKIIIERSVTGEALFVKIQCPQNGFYNFNVRKSDKIILQGVIDDILNQWGYGTTPDKRLKLFLQDEDSYTERGYDFNILKRLPRNRLFDRYSAHAIIGSKMDIISNPNK